MKERREQYKKLFAILVGIIAFIIAVMSFILLLGAMLSGSAMLTIISLCAVSLCIALVAMCMNAAMKGGRHREGKD